MSAGQGHNGGPALEPGGGWRRHCWTVARAELLPHLPLEVLRGRVRRARELGLEYRSYASIRAASGHDVVAFLFSSNALRILAPQPALPPDRGARLAAIERCARLALAQSRLRPADVLAAAGGLLDAAHAAPRPFAGWAEARRSLIEALSAAGPGRRPAPGEVVLIGDTGVERDWAAAARLAAYLPAERFFGAAAR